MGRTLPVVMPVSVIMPVRVAVLVRVLVHVRVIMVMAMILTFNFRLSLTASAYRTHAAIPQSTSSSLTRSSSPPVTCSW